MHDTHTPIAPSGLYWTAGLSEENLLLGADGLSATLEVADLPAVDEPLFPKPGPIYTALQSYRMTW